MPGIADYCPEVERWAWDLPEFYMLLRSAIAILVLGNAWAGSISG